MGKALWVVAAVLAGAITVPAEAAERTIGTLRFADCDLKSRGLPDVLGAQCATLQVPENPADPAGRKIGLRIGLVPARTAEAAADPVFFFAGGPGQSALESFPMIAPGFERMREKRHIILIDQRGTGGSNKLVCKGEVKNSGKRVTISIRMGQFYRKLIAKLIAKLAKSEE